MNARREDDALAARLDAAEQRTEALAGRLDAAERTIETLSERLLQAVTVVNGLMRAEIEARDGTARTRGARHLRAVR